MIIRVQRTGGVLFGHKGVGTVQGRCCYGAGGYAHSWFLCSQIWQLSKSESFTIYLFCNYINPAMKYAVLLSLFSIIWFSSCQPQCASEKMTVVGIVDSVFAHGTDLVININDDDGSYYLNRYLDSSGTVDSFRNLMLNKEIRILYYCSESPLNYRGLSRPIDTIFIGSKTIY